MPQTKEKTMNTNEPVDNVDRRLLDGIVKEAWERINEGNALIVELACRLNEVITERGLAEQLSARDLFRTHEKDIEDRLADMYVDLEEFDDYDDYYAG